MTAQYACVAGSFRCTRISTTGRRRVPAPAAYFAVRQIHVGGAWNKTVSATATIAKIPMLTFTRVKAAASDPAAAMTIQTYLGGAARIPQPARQTSNSMHSSCGWPGSLVKNCKARNTRRCVTDAAASDLVNRRTIQAQISAQRSVITAAVIRTALWFRTFPVADRTTQLKQ